MFDFKLRNSNFIEKNMVFCIETSATDIQKYKDKLMQTSNGSQIFMVK